MRKITVRRFTQENCDLSLKLVVGTGENEIKLYDLLAATNVYRAEPGVTKTSGFCPERSGNGGIITSDIAYVISRDTSINTETYRLFPGKAHVQSISQIHSVVRLRTTNCFQMNYLTTFQSCLPRSARKVIREMCLVFILMPKKRNWLYRLRRTIVFL